MTKKRSGPSICANARAVRMPSQIKPMLATLVDEPFSSPDWIFETKWDGYRSVCFLKNGKARFVSRNQIEMTPQYPELGNIGKQVRAKEAILDGEICALDHQGIPRFQMLQRKGGAQRPPIVYFVFDLLYVDGYDLTACTVMDRKAKLAEILQPSSVIKLSDHIDGDGEAFFREIAKFQLEGMMAKRADSRYVQKRSSEWLKIKTVMRQEVVVGGYTEPRGTRSHFGSLVCGLYGDDGLHYVAHIGGGFNEKLLASIHKLMQPLKSNKSPFLDAPKTNEPVQWLKPKLVAEVKFSEWTADNRLRHPVFVGLREDKDPRDCRFEFESDTDQVVPQAGKRGKTARRSKQ
ncbi:MAG TPA: non-homologous end-joining DNA ligase [Pyrinomonadaceae bacterium]|jgi:bifunctional non-homologous end joining protein LigD|nr:non-homologous end-joining DNA ligase [Pyrinomonadaceae bacterium]